MRVAYTVGLVAWLGSSAAWAQFLPLEPAQVVINAEGGATTEDGLRIHLGNLGGVQVVRAGSRQYYGDDPTGPEGVNNGFFMAVGPAGSATVYGPQLNIEWTAIPWTAVSQSAVTGAGTAEDPYQVVTIVSAGGFMLGQTVRYVVPKVYFDVRLTLLPQADNAQDVRVYHWLDTYLDGGDFGPAFSEPPSNPTVVGVAKNGQYELLIQGNRAWDAYFSGVYYRPGQSMELGGSLDNTLDTTPTTDNGIAAQWDIGAPTDPVTWTYRLATVQVSSATCGDGQIAGYEGCDDGDTDDSDGCSGICQVEVGYACTGAPSVCDECFEDIDCDDGDDCTTDTCSNNACGHTTAPQGTTCLTGVCSSGGTCVECVEDANCGPDGPLCDTQTNSCYCAADADCDDDNECTSEVCSQGHCAVTVLPIETECSIGHCNGNSDGPMCICDTNGDCDDQNSCSVDACVANQCSHDYSAAGDACDTGFCSEDQVPVCLQCFQDAHCPNDEPWCKTEMAECVECLDDGQCDDGNECTLDGCDNDVCSHDLRVGYACQAGGFCSDEAPVCVECVTSFNCPEEQSLCSNHECVACVVNDDCDDGNDCTEDICSAHVCGYSPVTPGTPCTGGYCAGTDSPACVTCADSADGALDDGCSQEFPVCLLEGNGASCVLCEAADDASGDFGCGDETPFCDASGLARTCVECRTTDDCVGDETCSSEGVCLGSDADGDGLSNADDLDDDDDGIADTLEASDTLDMDGDGLPNALDRDSDGDGIADVVEVGGEDTDGDGVWDGIVDTNHDGIADAREGDVTLFWSDADGSPDFLDADSDDDGIEDSVEASDADHDGVADQSASGDDNDNDGLDAAFDSTEGGTAVALPDQDNNGIPDYRDFEAVVVISGDSGVASGTNDEADSGAPSDTMTAQTMAEPTGATTSEVTEGSATLDPTEPEPRTSQPEAAESTPAASTSAAPTTTAPISAEPTSKPDAVTTAEATTDEVVDAGVDAGPILNVGGRGDGCDCRVAGAQSKRGAPSALWLLVLMGVLLKRRMRWT